MTTPSTPEINNPDYQAGYADGQADAQTLLLPANTGAHTQAEHDRIHEKCARCLMPADAYEAGYGAGLDDAARAAGFDDPTDDQIDAFHDNL
ncbi:MAG: hypothetical protein IPP13_21865 [Kouleothrix sp.]|jgi:hypothetical protein|nr:hypothetical protein [Kouleothrix sp.]